MPRKLSDTERLSYEKIMAPGARDNHYRLILQALRAIVDGTAWEIASQSRLKPDKVWKRLSELRRDEVIFDTGLRRDSPDGNKAMVYALSSSKGDYAHLPKPESYKPTDTTASDIACSIIAKTKKGRLVQQQLFEGT